MNDDSTSVPSRSLPSQPGNWKYDGDNEQYLHYWAYEKEDIKTYEAFIVKLPDSVYTLTIRDKINGEKLASRNGSDVNKMFGLADIWFNEIHEDGEVQTTSVEW